MQENKYSMQRIELPQTIQKEKVWLKAVRKKFSIVGLAFLGGSIFIYFVQLLVAQLYYVFFSDIYIDPSYMLLFSMIPMYLIGMPGMIFLITRIKVWKKIPQHRMSVGKLLVAFLMAYSILYISNLAGVVFTTVVGNLKGTPVENVVESMSMNTNMVCLFIFTVICAPIYEELIFRKLLLDRIVPYGEGVAILVSGFLFGLFHGNFSQFAYAFCLGLFLAFIYIRTGKIRYAIILHAMINFMGSIASLILLKVFDLEQFEMQLNQIAENPEALGMMSWSVLPGLIILLAYLAFIMCAVIAGVILLIVYSKKFKLQPAVAEIPKGKRFPTAIINVGMITMSLFWVVQILLQLLE